MVLSAYISVPCQSEFFHAPLPWFRSQDTLWDLYFDYTGSHVNNYHLY